MAEKLQVEEFMTTFRQARSCPAIAQQASQQHAAQTGRSRIVEPNERFGARHPYVESAGIVPIHDPFGFAASACTRSRQTVGSGSCHPGRQWWSRARPTEASACRPTLLRMWSCLIRGSQSPSDGVFRRQTRPALPPRHLQAREILARMMRGASERRGRDHQETLGIGDGLVSLEFIGRHEANDRMVLARRLQVLADRQKSTSAARRSSITCRISFRSSPRPTMMPDLVNIAGSISFTCCNRRSEAK